MTQSCSDGGADAAQIGGMILASSRGRRRGQDCGDSQGGAGASRVRCDAVAFCADARAALVVTPYDSAILDLGLPDGDGISLLSELRSDGNRILFLLKNVLGLELGDG
jgi:CheY-like chemotaxis protein